MEAHGYQAQDQHVHFGGSDGRAAQEVDTDPEGRSQIRQYSHEAYTQGTHSLHNDIIQKRREEVAERGKIGIILFKTHFPITQEFQPQCLII